VAPPRAATAVHTATARSRRGTFRERVDEHRQRGRGDQRGSETLRGPREHEHLGRRREAAGQRRRGEQAEPHDEDPPAPEGVGHAPRSEQAAREHQDVRRDDPLQRPAPEPEVPADHRQGHDDRVDVEHADELGRAQQDEQRQPGPHAPLTIQTR
jgi:hypothetical protein